MDMAGRIWPLDQDIDTCSMECLPYESIGTLAKESASEGSY